jgi:hypothetical protein
MWQVLADGLAIGLADDLEAWERYEQASRGHKQVTFSRGLRRRYRLAEEQEDQDIVDQDHGGEDLVVLPAATWSAVRGCAEELLTAAERDGLPGVAVWLSAQRTCLATRRTAMTERSVTRRSNGPMLRCPQRHAIGEPCSLFPVPS